jgi:hypothetical protein
MTQSLNKHITQVVTPVLTQVTTHATTYVMSPQSEHILPWTATQDEQLRRLANANIPLQVIGFRLGRRPEAVARRASELGVHCIERKASMTT